MVSYCKTLGVGLGSWSCCPSQLIRPDLILVSVALIYIIPLGGMPLILRSKYAMYLGLETADKFRFCVKILCLNGLKLPLKSQSAV
jgi:hypothetical protein